MSEKMHLIVCLCMHVTVMFLDRPIKARSTLLVSKKAHSVRSIFISFICDVDT